MATRTTIVLGLLVAVLVAPGASGTGLAAREANDGTAASCDFPLTLTDATGTEVTIREESERVVTVNPSAAQTMWEIGAREKVVGLTKYALYLDGADSRTIVSSAGQIVVAEKVVALDPDLVLAPNATSKATVERLREVGLTVYHFPEAESIEDVYAKTLTIGRLVGGCDGAQETVAWMRERIGTVREAVEGEPRPDVLYAFFGFTAGRGTFIHTIIEAAGGNNVAADYGVEGYRKLNPEVVVEADPDWIIRNSAQPDLPEGAPFDATTAVQKGQIVVVRYEYLNQPAPRIVYVITTLAKHFHPEAYAAANATTATLSPRTEPTLTTTTNPATSIGTAGQPGFGAVAALLAVAIALFAAGGRR